MTQPQRDRQEPNYNSRRGVALQEDERPAPIPGDDHGPMAPSRRLGHPQPAPIQQVDRSPDRQEGTKDLISGLVLIGIGMMFGGSVFTGDPTIIDWLFDGLGAFWIAKGIYGLVR